MSSADFLIMAQVRGPNYLKDRKKIPAKEPAFTLAAVDLLEVEKPTLHIARFLPSLRCEIPAASPGNRHLLHPKPEPFWRALTSGCDAAL